MKKFLSSISLFLILLTFAVPSQASTTVGGRVDSNTTWTLANSPYILTSTVEIPRGVSLTVEAGVEIRVQHANTVFRSAGAVVIEGTSTLPVTFVGQNPVWDDAAINTLWETAGDWRSPSSLTMRFVVARNIRGVLTALNQGQSVNITDSVFEGSEGSRLQRPIYQWLTFCEVCRFERNSFERLPAIKLSSNAFWNGTRTLQPEVVVRDNLFLGNSTTLMSWSSWGNSGEWIIADKLTSFSGNSFVDFETAVIGQVDETEPWVISDNYFDGLTASAAQNYVNQGLVAGATVQSVLLNPSANAPVKGGTKSSSNSQLLVQLAGSQVFITSADLQGKFEVYEDGQFIDSFSFDGVNQAHIVEQRVTGAIQIRKIEGGSASQVGYEYTKTLLWYQNVNLGAFSETNLGSAARDKVKNLVNHKYLDGSSWKTRDSQVTKFICTGIYREGGSAAEKLSARKKAKLACESAVSLDSDPNSKVSFYYQTKTTKAASYVGKVLVTVKGIEPFVASRLK